MPQTATRTAEADNMLFQKRDLIRLIIPLIIEQTLALSVGMFDTIMVSSAGEAAVSGVSLVESINYLLINLFSALATGGAIVAAQYLGRRDRENAGKAAKQLVIAIFFLSLLIALVCLALNRPLLSLLFGRIAPEVMGNARSYFYITALSYPFIALFNASAALFRGMGNSKIAMVNALIMNGLNVCGNAVFIYGFGWGAFGAGLATTLSRMVGALTMLLMLRNPELLVSVRSYRLREIDFGMIRRILRIGIPNGLENSMFQFGRVIMTSLVAVQGTAAITANAVGNSLSTIAVIPGQAMALALTTVVAQCVGAGEYGQANHYMKRLLRFTYLCMAVVNIGILVALDPLLGLFGLSAEPYALARQILFIHNLCAMLIWPVSFTLPSAFRAAGDVRFTMIVAILSMWIVRVGGSYLLAYGLSLGVLSVWIGMFSDWVVRTACFLWRWSSGRWKHSSVL